MVCNKESNLKNGWNRYCTGIDKIHFGKYYPFKNDTIWGVYIGCPCKKHDIRYSKEGLINSRKEVDKLFMLDICKAAKEQGKLLRGIIIAPIIYFIVRVSGWYYWKTWSSKNLARYK